MSEYHKINSIYKRNPKTKVIIEGDFACPEFEYLQYNTWNFSEKIDGTNIRVIYDAEARIVNFAGRTDNARLPGPLFVRLLSLFSTDKLHEIFNGKSVILYGEGYGPKIQNGGYFSFQNFVLFDVRIGRWYLEQPAIADIADRFAIPCAPFIGEGTLHDAVFLAKVGFTSKFSETGLAEGIVARPKVKMFNRAGNRIITKIKYRDFH
jgi:hypothetical protein